MTLHEELERKIAELKGTEAALVFNSGFQANTGIIPVLVGEGDVILSDGLNHASIIDGCRLARAKIFVYRHCDMNELERGLKNSPPRWPKTHRYRVAVQYGRRRSAARRYCQLGRKA